MQTKNSTKFSFINQLLKHCLVLMLFVSILTAQSLQDRIDNLKDLQRQAINADRIGNYDLAIELAKQIQFATDDINALINASRKWYILRNKLSIAEQLKAEEYAPEEYGAAQELQEEGTELIEENNFEDAESALDEGIIYADAAIEKARGLYITNNNSKTEVTESEVQIVVEKSPGSEYEVRLIPSRRDSLWRIAEYEFIYNDPWKWPIIFEANRDKIKNPDLIYPGQKLTIPAIENSNLRKSLTTVEEIEDDVMNDEDIPEYPADEEDSMEINENSTNDEDIPEYPADEEDSTEMNENSTNDEDIPEYPADEEEDTNSEIDVETIDQDALYDASTSQKNISILEEASLAINGEKSNNIETKKNIATPNNAYISIPTNNITPNSVLQEIEKAQQIN